MASERKNATITGARIGYDRGTFLTIWLDLDYGGSGQSYGGFVFCAPVKDAEGRFSHREIQGAAFGVAIDGILRAVGVEKWSDLKGQPVRVEAEHSKVHRIGHFLKDRWFRYEDAFEQPAPPTTTNEGAEGTTEEE